MLIRIGALIRIGTFIRMGVLVRMGALIGVGALIEKKNTFEGGRLFGRGGGGYWKEGAKSNHYGKF